MAKLTIKDIARFADVGITTVSKVLNDRPGVSATTRSKVLQIVREHNFTPNRYAKNLKMRRNDRDP